MNNGVCIDGINGYQCECIPGYAGELCDQVVDPCAANPCKNGGTCISDANEAEEVICFDGYPDGLGNMIGDYCTPGFKHMEHACGVNNQDDFEKGNYLYGPFDFDASIANKDPDDHCNALCDCNSICVKCSQGAASFVCECANGWTGATCEEEGCKQEPGSQIFDYTGGEQTFIVPECVETLTIEVWGAEGGDSDVCGGDVESDGGSGGYATGKLTVIQGETLFVYVGGKGATAGGGGYNGGGAGGTWGGGGGGASDVRQTGNTLDDRIIVAGGGGGGNTGCPNHGTGGPGGGADGGTGQNHNGNYTPGGGGSQNAGGQPGSSCSPGTLGQGGSDGGYHKAGGGGGYYGGGCAYASGGGGGSGYVGGVSDGSMQSGVQNGNGQIKISW